MKPFIGHQDTYAHLVAQVKGDHLTHALLFRGEEGIGKKLIALHLAKIILVGEDAPFDLATFPDLLLVEEESIKVNDVTRIQEFLSERPLYSKHKVVIIDNCHLMNHQSQNKFLKTLEEAPGFATIIMITSQVTKLLDTIVSRLSEWSFKPLSEEQVYSLLPSEYPEKLKRLATYFSAGSIGKALRILGDEIHQEIFFLPEKIFEAVLNDDIDKLLKFSNLLQEQKELYPVLLDYMGVWIRDVSVIREDHGSQNLLYRESEESLIRHSNYYRADLIPKINQRIQRAREEIEANIAPEIVVFAMLHEIKTWIH